MMSHQRQSLPDSVRTYALPPIVEPRPAAITVRVVYGCPHCGQPLRLRPEYFGRPLACKRCDRRFVPSLAHALTGLSGRSAGEIETREPARRRVASG